MTIAAETVWRVRTGGDNTNGGGFNSANATAGTDYSKQDTVQFTLTDAIFAGGTTFTTVAGGILTTHPGNIVRIAGAGLTTQFYELVTRIDGNTGVMDRTPGTGTATTFRLGGAWADPWTNTASSTTIAQGNTIYVRGGGTDNPGSADYTKSGGGFITLVIGGSTGGMVSMIGENGRPLLSSDGLMFFNQQYNHFENLGLMTTGTSNANSGILKTTNACTIINVSINQNGKDCLGLNVSGGLVLGCEIYSGTINGGAAGTYPAIQTATYGARIDQCNIHEAWGDGINSSNDMATIENCIISKCTGNGVTLTASTSQFSAHVHNNPIDANKGHGISFAGTSTLLHASIGGNLITNHVTAGKYGINIAAGTTALNDRAKQLVDGNWFYNNTVGNHNTVSAGVNSTANTDPVYVDQTTQDYALQSTSPVLGKGYPVKVAPDVPIGASPARFTTIQASYLRRSTTPTVKNYFDAGAVQRVIATISAIISSFFLMQ